MDINKKPESATGQENELAFNSSRRQFFQMTGALAGAGLLIASCRRTPPSDTYLGAGDVALLNYLYVLKQVTVALYTQAVATPYYGITQSELELQTDLRDQEVAHREFLKKLLGADAVKTVVTQLSQVTFDNKSSFLTNASTLEDISAAAYPGVIKLLKNQSYIAPLSKMCAVDGRHAGYVREVLTHNFFFSNSNLDSNALNWVMSPALGMAQLGNYLETRFDTSKLPTF